MTDPDPLSVQCPSCLAPAGEACRSNVEATHADRLTSARLFAVEHGTCQLCGQPMVLGIPTVGDQETAWHPHPADAATCPPMADPDTDWNTYAAQVQSGLEPGRPGREHFLAAGAVLPRQVWCPECTAGKHVNCVGQALDPVTDELTTCTCEHQP